MAQLTVDPSRMTKSTQTLTDALVYCREHSLNSEQQQEVVAHSKGTFLDAILCPKERQARLYGQPVPLTVKTWVQKHLRVLQKDSQWYDKILEGFV